MRLLKRSKAGKISLTNFDNNDNVPPYAILSHTWDRDEVLFKEMMDGTGERKLGYHKIQFCADQAWRDGLQFFWVDTCCIDKASSAELQEAINCMFRWYRGAAKCYVYLADVSTPAWETPFRTSRWFTRGWTLQELIAPESVEFFSKGGTGLGDKTSLEQDIHTITGVPVSALRGSPLSDFSVSERMAWMEKRETTRQEDKAYSLLGIFDVCIPLLYGEGREKALKRLQEEVNASKDEQTRRCLADLRLTDPRDDMHRIAYMNGGLFREASRWILGHGDFCRWRDRDEGRLLWIKGDPGKGKTMLLITIVEDLERQVGRQPRTASSTALSYFFCQGTHEHLNSAVAVLRGLIYLLCIQQPPLASHLRARYDHAGVRLFQSANSFFALSKVLESIMYDKRLQRAYLVVDALDECMTDRDQLLRFIAGHCVALPRVKWIVSSRNIAAIENLLEIDSSDGSEVKLSLEVTQNAEQVARAVEAFIDHKLSNIRSLQDDHDTRAQVREVMRGKANGTFLWVALVVEKLGKAESWDMLEILEELPEKLDDLYSRMMQQIQNLKRKNPEFCRLVLSAATLAYRPLHLTELAIVSGLPAEIASHPSRVRRVVALCGSFLTVKESVVYHIHQSVKDYLSGRASRALFLSGPGQVHRAMFARSVQALSAGRLRRNMYGLPSIGMPIEDVTVPEPDPLAGVRYSCIYWARHLCDVGPGSSNRGLESEDLEMIDHFIRRFFLYWLEAVALLRSMSQSIISIRRLETFLQVRILSIPVAGSFPN